MDRLIVKKAWPVSRIITVLVVVGVVSVLAMAVINRTGSSRLSVDPTRLTISQATVGEFREYYPFDGTVVPETSVYLDVEEGGRVEAIHLEGGQWVEEGDLILTISNDALQRTSIDTETRLLENLDQISNTQFNRAQSNIILKDQLLDMDYRILALEKRFNRFEPLLASDAISQEQFDEAKDELDYLIKKRELLHLRIQQEDMLSQQQLAQAENSIDRLNVSLEMVSRIVESLEVRAPISGHLSSIDAELGQSIGRGQRIGQIDLLDKFKIRVEVDQYYLDRIGVGTIGRFRLNQKDYPVEVRKIFPEVTNNIFEIDVDFVGKVPESIRRGQTLTVELNFGEAEESLMVRKGGFYQQTSGRWVYLISEDGKTARRAEIRLGRQNPQFVEVLEGLREGDRIITSGYDSFNEIEELVFTEALDY